MLTRVQKGKDAFCKPVALSRIATFLLFVLWQVVTSSRFEKFYTSDREINALIDYEVALAAHRMIGNSVSTFTALAIFQRRHRGQWAAYYNGGNIPLAEFLPMDPLPWVRTAGAGQQLCPAVHLYIWTDLHANI
jgi:hypothetical protein